MVLDGEVQPTVVYIRRQDFDTHSPGFGDQTLQIHAIKSDNEQLAAATLAYLAIRLPDLQQVVAEEKDGETHIKLIYDQEYVKAQPVQFVKPGQLNS